jgi:hypothetical protein
MKGSLCGFSKLAPDTEDSPRPHSHLAVKSLPSTCLDPQSRNSSVDSVLTRGSKLSTTLRARCVMLTAITRF